jgi:putative ABC transport system permease protein
MIFLKLILTNLLRHRIRSLISIAGIAFSVAAMLTIVTILQGAVGMFSGILSSDSQIIVFERNVSDLFFSNVPATALTDISAWSTVQHADPVLFGVVTSADHPIITCFGITAADARLRKATWLEGSRANFARQTGSPAGGLCPLGCKPNDVVLGQRAAEFLHAHLNSTVAIGHGSFHVAGIIQTANGFEDGGVFMPLPAAQDFFHKPGASSVITIKLTDKKFADEFKQRVKEKFPDLIALEDAEFTRSYSQFKILKATAWTVGGCGLILGGLGVANTMIMSVFTRIREIAILRVNGFSNLQIATMIFGESALVSVVGAITGLLLGAALLTILKLIPALHGYVDVAIQPLVVLIVIVLSFLTGVAGALYPAIYAMRIRAVEALRFE